MTWAKMKSAKDRSGLMPEKSFLFWELDCKRRQTKKEKKNQEN